MNKTTTKLVLCRKRGEMMYYYHVSKMGDLKTLKPSIPNNEMVKDYGENGTIPRVCVSPNINQCLNALGGLFRFEEVLYVYSIWLSHQ